MRLCCAAQTAAKQRPSRNLGNRCTHGRSGLFDKPVSPSSGQSYLHKTWRLCRKHAKRQRCALLVDDDGIPNLGSIPVRVFEQSKEQSRRVVAEALVHAPVEQVWEVLTDYERLPSFVPNLESCQRVPCPTPGRLRVLQRACSQSLLWRLEAEAVLEIEELERLPGRDGEAGRKEARFFLVSGDFQELSGRWVLEPCGMACMLRYDITMVPKLLLPATITNHVVRAGLPANILAVTQRAEQLAAQRLKATGLASWAGLEEDAPLPPSPTAPRSQQQQQQASESAVFPAASSAADGAGDVAPSMEEAEWGEEDGAGVVRGPGQPAEGLPMRWSSDDALPTSGPFWSFKSKFAASAPLTAAQQRRRLGLRLGLGRSGRGPADPSSSSYLGVVSVPLPPSGSPREVLEEGGLQARLNESQRLKVQLQASYPAFGLRRPGEPPSFSGGVPASGSSSGSSSGGGGSTASIESGWRFPLGWGSGTPASSLVSESALAEVHLRRLDGFDFLHRRAVAAITIDATPEEVWSILTDYDKLAEFIPNLAASQRIALPKGAPHNVVRVRQVGYKRMLYMAMHAESVLDLVEKEGSEIQFRQVAGDFERFQGKWMLQDVGALGEAQTQLKYAVEIIIPRTCRLLGVMEPIMERCVFEDMPANLAAVKQRVEAMRAAGERAARLARVESLEEAGEVGKAAALRKKLDMPRPKDMYQDFSLLAAELERCFGDAREIPGRRQLREMMRSDLEKAIAYHGGPAAVAQALGWEAWGGRKKGRNRKPRGYWDSLGNVKGEIQAFIAENQLEPDLMPAKNEFVRAGRYDLARAVEKWGGVSSLAEELEWGLAGGKERWYEHLREVAEATGLSGSEGLFEEAAKTYSAKRGGSVRSMSSMDLDDGIGQAWEGRRAAMPLVTAAAAAAPSSAGSGTLSSNGAVRGRDISPLPSPPLPQQVPARASAAGGSGSDSRGGKAAMGRSGSPARKAAGQRSGREEKGGAGEEEGQRKQLGGTMRNLRSEIDSW